MSGVAGRLQEEGEEEGLQLSEGPLDPNEAEMKMREMAAVQNTEKSTHRREHGITFLGASGLGSSPPTCDFGLHCAAASMRAGGLQEAM